VPLNSAYQHLPYSLLSQLLPTTITIIASAKVSNKIPIFNLPKWLPAFNTLPLLLKELPLSTEHSQVSQSIQLSI
jgi:hypothetical protein